MLIGLNWAPPQNAMQGQAASCLAPCAFGATDITVIVFQPPFFLSDVSGDGLHGGNTSPSIPMGYRRGVPAMLVVATQRSQVAF